MWETSNKPPSRVLHRHRVTGERHHAGAQFEMQGVQRRVLQRGFLG
jgi:hypothetical protein